MRINLIITTTLLFTAGCEHVPGTDANKIAAAKEQIASRMKDPTSVIFTNVRISEDGSVCGQLNAKNSFGAYTGNEGFLYRDGGTDLLLENGSLTDNPGIAAGEKCQFRKLHPVCMKGGNVLQESVDAATDGECQREAKKAIDATYREALNAIR